MRRRGAGRCNALIRHIAAVSCLSLLIGSVSARAQTSLGPPLDVLPPDMFAPLVIGSGVEHIIVPQSGLDRNSGSVRGLTLVCAQATGTVPLFRSSDIAIIGRLGAKACGDPDANSHVLAPLPAGGVAPILPPGGPADGERDDRGPEYERQPIFTTQGSGFSEDYSEQSLFAELSAIVPLGVDGSLELFSFARLGVVDQSQFNPHSPAPGLVFGHRVDTDIDRSTIGAGARFHFSPDGTPFDSVFVGIRGEARFDDVDMFLAEHRIFSDGLVGPAVFDTRENRSGIGLAWQIDAGGTLRVADNIFTFSGFIGQEEFWQGLISGAGRPLHMNRETGTRFGLNFSIALGVPDDPGPGDIGQPIPPPRPPFEPTGTREPPEAASPSSPPETPAESVPRETGPRAGEPAKRADRPADEDSRDLPRELPPSRPPVAATAPGGKTDETPTSPPAPPSSSTPAAQKMVCGPDITGKVHEVLERLHKTWDGWGTLKRHAQCAKLWSPTHALDAWDIAELSPDVAPLPEEKYYDVAGKTVPYQSYLNNREHWFQPWSPNCATPHTPCGPTVVFLGQCIHSQEVNYILWGFMNKLCDHDIAQWLPHAARSLVKGVPRKTIEAQRLMAHAGEDLASILSERFARENNPRARSDGQTGYLSADPGDTIATAEMGLVQNRFAQRLATGKWPSFAARPETACQMTCTIPAAKQAQWRDKKFRAKWGE